MASVFIYVYSYGYPLEAAVLQPGASRFCLWGPSDSFNDTAIVLTPHPVRINTLGPTMKVSDVQKWSIKTPIGTVGSTTEHYVGAHFTNIGADPIEAFKITVGVIIPGPDGH